MMGITSQNTSPKVGLKIYIEDYLNYWSTHPRELQFTFLSLAKIMSSEAIWKEMESYLEYTTGFFEKMLSEGIRCGEFKNHDTSSRALLLASSLDGITPYIIMCKNLTRQTIIESFIQTLISEIEEE